MRKYSPYFWFLHKEQTLFKGRGLYSDITVTKRGSRVNLYTGGKGFLQTTYDPESRLRGTHLEWYLSAPLFAGNFNGALDSMLILGLGGGAQVKLYNRFYKVKQIVAVEIDPLISDLGKKYFDLTDENLQIVASDAFAYLKHSQEIFDLIIVDAFKEELFDDACQSEEFLTKAQSLLSSKGVLFINKLITDNSNVKMEAHLKKMFQNVYVMKMQYTLFFVATNSKSAPFTKATLIDTFIKFSQSSNQLKFFKKIKNIINSYPKPS